jgi:Tol biopolymer transport system component
MNRSLVVIGLLLAMLLFGFGVYHGAELLKDNKPSVHRPSEITAPGLPGTMYLAQGGAIYRFKGGTFTQITPEAGWMQPAMAPDGRQLVAVQRRTNWSDLFLLTPAGKPTSMVTHNNLSQLPEYNHWAFYPRFSPDGSSIFYNYDPKDSYNSYQVDLAIFASPGPSWRNAVQWTIPHAYTGGDVGPIPLKGGLVYTKFSIDDQGAVHSQVWLQTRPGSPGLALTPKEVNCVQPAVSPDQKSIAMVCTRGQTQSAEIDIMSFDASAPTAGSLTTLVSGHLVAAPAFSPDGKTIAYLSPVVTGGAFQLWTVGSSGQPAASAITTNLGLDSTSAPVWMAG